jgi:uncharacterized protein Yka (UPF0111/DUF47 family)
LRTKEKKFWDLFHDLCDIGDKEGRVLYEAVQGHIDADEAYDQGRHLKKAARAIFIKLAERVYRAYKDPFVLDAAKLLVTRTYENIDRINSVLSKFSIYEIDEKPEGLVLMVRLVASSMIELHKVLDYTHDIENNYMKMEARCSRIHAYEERGDETFRDGLRNVFGHRDDPVYIIYWKDILENLELLLDTCSGNVRFLQKMLTIKFDD